MGNPARKETVATTIKLSEEIKARASAVAASAGVTTHAFLVAAVEQVVAQAEQRQAFLAEADAAEDQVMRTGKAIPLAAATAYFKARAAGKKAPRPKAVKWRK